MEQKSKMMEPIERKGITYRHLTQPGSGESEFFYKVEASPTSQPNVSIGTLSGEIGTISELRTLSPSPDAFQIHDYFNRMQNLDKSINETEQIAFLTQVNVDPARQRQGIASMLVELFESNAIKRGCSRLITLVLKADYDARGFWEKMTSSQDWEKQPHALAGVKNYEKKI